MCITRDQSNGEMPIVNVDFRIADLATTKEVDGRTVFPQDFNKYQGAPVYLVYKQEKKAGRSKL